MTYIVAMFCHDQHSLTRQPMSLPFTHCDWFRREIYRLPKPYRVGLVPDIDYFEDC